MADLPEFVYLITMESQWPVTAVVDYGDAGTARRVEEIVDERVKSGYAGTRRNQVHVWKARLADVREVDLVPAQTIGPELRERDNPEEQR